MAALVPLTLHQKNDEILDIVITAVMPTDDLSLVTSLIFYLKPDECTEDTDATVTVLTSAVPAQITITLQTPTEIDATVYVPAVALAKPYPRVWRLDAHVGTTNRTAMYGPVTIVKL